MAWIKIRERWSSGYGDWEYREIGDTPFSVAKDEYIERYDGYNYYSEHWRGLDVIPIELAEVPEEKFTGYIDHLAKERRTWEEQFNKALARYEEWKQAKGNSSRELG